MVTITTQAAELEKLKYEKEVELGTIKHKTECAKLEVQQYQLQLVKDGKLSDVCRLLATQDGISHFDLINNLCLLPKFSVSGPDTEKTERQLAKLIGRTVS